MRILSFVSLLAIVLAASGPVAAQNVAPGKTLVLVPYAEPGNKDPHAAGVTASIASELPAQGITVVTAASLAAVASLATKVMMRAVVFGEEAASWY